MRRFEHETEFMRTWGGGNKDSRTVSATSSSFEVVSTPAHGTHALNSATRQRNSNTASCGTHRS